MRGEAIRSIGIGGDPKSLDALQEIYNAGGADVKEEVLQAWMIAGRKESVYQAALNAKTEEEATEAIRMLGVMGATDELRKLGDRPNAASGLVEAYAISGDLASLRKIAEGNGERSVRVEAVRRIGIIESDAARAALREIYARSTDAEIKEAALQGMLIAGDEQGVLRCTAPRRPARRSASLLRMLSMMDGDAALAGHRCRTGEEVMNIQNIRIAASCLAGSRWRRRPTRPNSRCRGRLGELAGGGGRRRAGLVLLEQLGRSRRIAAVLPARRRPRQLRHPRPRDHRRRARVCARRRRQGRAPAGVVRDLSGGSRDADSAISATWPRTTARAG